MSARANRVAVACALLLVCPGLAARDNKKMCITFNELPAAATFDKVDPEAIHYLIRQGLKRNEISAAGFVVGANIGERFDLLGEWLNDGHVLGQMTFNNQDLHQLGIDESIADIEAGDDAIETMLSGFGQKRRYFRFPFLHYGTTVEIRNQFEMYLYENDYTIVHATVVIEDYLYNLSLEKMGKIPDSAEFAALGKEYVEHVMAEVNRVDALARKMLNRRCTQILQLRANRVNAVYLEDLLGALKSEGWEFVPLRTALEDPVYGKNDAYFGPKGIGYLDMLQQSDADFLPAE